MPPSPPPSGPPLSNPPPSTSPLTPHLIPGPPPSMYYLPHFLTPAEESLLLSTIASTPLPQWRQLSHRRLQSQPSQLTAQNVLLDEPLPGWLVGVAGRIAGMRVGETEGEGDGDGDGENDGDGEGRGADGRERGKLLFSGTTHRAPNHCLINEYLPGQGIMPHEDGPAYAPITATVSLGGQAVLEVRRKKKRGGHEDGGGDGNGDWQDDGAGNKDGGEREAEEEENAWRILCEPRSLLITMGDAYVSTLHAIEGVEVDEGVGDPRAEGGMAGTEGSGRPRGVANWDLLGDREGWVRDGGRRKRETRVSLTFRDVVKVKSMKAFGGVFGKRK